MCGLAFVGTKMWFVLTLANFIVGLQYGILPTDPSGPGRWALIGCRAACRAQLEEEEEERHRQTTERDREACMAKR